MLNFEKLAIFKESLETSDDS